MPNKIMSLFFVLSIAIYCSAKGQSTMQQGLVYKVGTSIRLGSVRILNKRSLTVVKSNTIGVFRIPASSGDTLEISSPGYLAVDFIVTDFADKVLFLKPNIALSEVVIRENSIQADLNEVKRGYRKKSVFYTGTPHYYYLALKPMTFIYENFKSEVINARKFNKYAKNEMAYYEIAARFNDYVIKNIVPIKDEELDDFKSDFWPALEQVSSWNDYDMDNYIRKSYLDFKSKGNAAKVKKDLGL
ncbi:MAG: hypothetical protein JWP37_3442 [Mucilaginibacter sp.]|nr:hypothetical protein [Mucilaginibacter sp.]